MTPQQRADALERRIRALPPHSRKRIALQAICIQERSKALKAEIRAKKRGH